MKPSLILALLLAPFSLFAAEYLDAVTEKPPLHGRNWVAITGKPAGAMAGARMFEKGGNAIDAACAMLGVVCTMYDDVAWGGETQALIYNPHTKKVVGVNALGVAPTGATPEFFKEKKLRYPPEYGPLAAVTPGNPGGLMVMLAEFGTMSLKQVLEPAMQMAEGYPIEADLVRKIDKYKTNLMAWPYSKKVFFPHPGSEWEAPRPGEIWRQPDLLATLQKLVDAEAQALRAGKSRKEAIMAAYARFYSGDIAEEFCRASQEMGGLHTVADLAGWKVLLEEPVSTSYRGIDVYKLTCWTQGPAMLQALNILENFDLKSMSYNTARYIHTVYQAMNLAFADRDFYYGDIYTPPVEPIATLLSKDYAKARAKLIDPKKNNPDHGPGDPYEFKGEKNPYANLLKDWMKLRHRPKPPGATASASPSNFDGMARMTSDEAFHAGTTSIQAADKSGWIISVTPSGGWIPSCVAGGTGMGMSQRMQSFVVDEAENPYNVVAPGKRPRVTLTPTLALKDGKPFLCFSVQGGDTQDQNLLQFFLNFVEFGMSAQEACEAANFTSYQMWSSFGEHAAEPGRVTLTDEIPSWTRKELKSMGYKLDFIRKNSGPITAIYFDWKNGSMWGGASNHGEDYGLAW